MELQLTEDQAALLRDVLDSAWRDLRYEVANTDLSSYKDELREREQALGEILGMVGGPIERD